jgi:hypothetical protein
VDAKDPGPEDDSVMTPLHGRTGPEMVPSGGTLAAVPAAVGALRQTAQHD